MEVLKKEFDAPYYGKRLKLVIVDSPESVKHDYFNQVNFSWKRLRDITVPVTFIHGELDTIHKVSDLNRLIASIGDIRLVTMKDSGHIMQYNHFRTLLRSVLRRN